MIRFLSGKLKKHTKLAKIAKISEIFNRLVFPLNFNRFCHPMTATGGIKTHYLHEPFEFYYLENFLAEFRHNKFK